MDEKNGLRSSSLLVPSVQELANDPRHVDIVPERYLHDEIEAAKSIDIEQLPVIDLASLLEDDPSEFAKLHLACTNWGFFQVVGHGVSAELIERLKVESKNLFELPMEDKRKYGQTRDDREGFGQSFVVSEKQKLEWADSFFVTIHPPQLRRPHLLPLLPLPIREILESYTTEIKQLGKKIFDCVAKDLKINKEHLRGLFDDNGRQCFRVAYYPPCPQYDKVIGSSPHSDASGLTILLQLNQVDGLQIKKDGRWLPISPLPNAFIVNVGDTMEIVSNGIYRSVEHRVMVDPKFERISAAIFFHAGLNTEVGPTPSLVSSDAPARFRSMSTTDYFNGLYARPLDGKSYLDTLRVHH